MNVLDETLGSLKAHWNQLVREIIPLLPRAKHLDVRNSIVVNQAAATLTCENLQNLERGSRRIEAVPLLWSAGQNVAYWVSYFEDWEYVGGKRPYRFKAANLTFFLGSNNYRPAIQIFRVEWAGMVRNSLGDLSWPSPGAGHPHWQFDAVEHYTSSRRRVERRERLAQLLEQMPGGVELFDPETVRLADDLVSKEEEEADDTSWTAMHFASGARWPKEPWLGDRTRSEAHIWAPAELSQIRAWTKSAVAYTREELLKATKGCQI